MAFTHLDSDSEFGQRALRRLRDDKIAWFTSVDLNGVPQPAPVWFLWDDASASALIYNQPSAKRISRLITNPNSSLHLNDDGAGTDFVVVTGTIAPAADVAQADEHAGYVEKYGEWMNNVFGSHERFAVQFSVPLVFHAERYRGH